MSARLLRAYLRTPLRGRTRLTMYLAHRLEVLQSLPLGSDDAYPVHVDLRDPSNHDLLRGGVHSLDVWEPGTHTVLQRFVREGDVVFDVGANRGIYVARLARQVGPRGHVYAFEPNPAFASCLARTAATAGCVTMLPYALSDSEGEVRLSVPSNAEMASLATQEEPDVPSVACAARRLDALAASGEVAHPQFIKMDIEGAEHRAFAGGRAMLDRRDAPVLIFESNVFASPKVSGVPVTEVADWLRQLEAPSYKLFVVYSWGLIVPLVPGQLVHENVLAVPAARVQEWPELSSQPYIKLDV
jgi:FkbM family methyltransferase